MFISTVVIAWLYVVVMMAAAEALSPQGTVLGAVFTLLLYGALPLGLVIYVMATPARKRARRAREAEEDAARAAARAAAAGSDAPDQRREAPAADAVAPEGKET